MDHFDFNVGCRTGCCWCVEEHCKLYPIWENRSWW